MAYRFYAVQSAIPVGYQAGRLDTLDLRTLERFFALNFFERYLLLFDWRHISLTWGILNWDRKSNISENGLEKYITPRQVQIVISQIPKN